MAHILLVEDDLGVRLVMEHVLIGGGCEVDATGRVLAGSVLLGSYSYDLVVTDVRLPDGSGIQVANRAREQGIPALIVTGYPFLPGDAVNHFDVLLKPIRAIKLLQAVERALKPNWHDTPTRRHARNPVEGRGLARWVSGSGQR